MNLGQHRLELIQLVNWGTFNGAFTLPVPREGLLVTGPSGSGKSSLLDALASVLVQPKWLSFNAAAQEGGAADRHRSLVSYVRGAYKREADDATGEVAAAYLRTEATWSGIALTFNNGIGTRTGLVRLLHLPRGTNASNDLSSLFVVTDGQIDLLELAPFVENGINTRQLRAAHPTWSTHPTYAGFAARLQRRLGLASDQAQRLLHKTQSAKNLTSLDTLLRDFMLDEPDAFGLADDAVTQFQELSQAHSSVVDARRQVDLLDPLRGIEADFAEHTRRGRQLADQETHLRTVVVELNVDAATSELHAVEEKRSALAEELSRADHDVSSRETARDLSRSALDGLGGREIHDLERAIERQRDTVAKATRNRTHWEARCTELGLTLPNTATGFLQFRAQAQAARAVLDESGQSRQERYDLADQAAQGRRRVEALDAQLTALARQKSNLDERLLEVRRLLLESAEMPRERLPFAGELIDVRPEESRWRGAIERVLRSFARTLLVPDDLYPHVSEFVERTHLGTRLVYERIPPGTVEAGTLEDPRSLVAKLRITDAEASGWIKAELVRRFDYRCVDKVSELRAVPRGATVAGQVKHSSTRHEKDDRSRIDDQTTWVLGTSTDAKRHLLEESLAQAHSDLRAAEQVRDRADTHRAERLRRANALDRLLELTWDELDLDTRQADLATLTGQFEALLASATGLAEAKHQLALAEDALGAARTRRDDVFGLLRTAMAKADTLRANLADWHGELATAIEPPAETRVAVIDRLAKLGPSRDKAEVLARQQLAEARHEIIARANRAANRAERIMQAYKADWPIPAQDWAVNIEFLPDFLGRLDLLEADRLPEFEDRFFTLLRTQSQNNIGILSTRLRNARREVRERVDPINASLRLTEYSPGRHLHVRVDDRRLPDVTEFLQTLSLIAGGTLSETIGAGSDEEARVQAEQRFERMKKLLQRLASAEPVDQRWRQQCLDTRQHVKFVAEVRDDDGRAVDFFIGAGGLSGGERQKLVIFCLAAALRYQLARDGAQTPSYGLVVLDEAFDKTDPAFTKAGLEVFQQFGFQLLLATPLKMLQTLEDYVGGAAVVLNESGHGSRLEYLDFGHPTHHPGPEPTDQPQETLL
ncbi:MAG: SbcC/MukB-like Walker B domain-containing protein [Propionicimonas sp.]